MDRAKVVKAVEGLLDGVFFRAGGFPEDKRQEVLRLLALKG